MDMAKKAYGELNDAIDQGRGRTWLGIERRNMGVEMILNGFVRRPLDLVL
jgi:hypothetical protein